MIGTARTHGAISVLNALFDGIGGSIGIDLPMEVTIEVVPNSPTPGQLAIAPSSSDTPVARGFLSTLLPELRSVPAPSVRVRIRSGIPIGSGLKSSSALGTAFVLALARAQGRTVSPESAARESSRIARATGQSATGAFEDCLASLLAGAWITDNRHERVLRHDPVPDGLEVVLWIPPGRHAPSPELASRFTAAAGALGHRLAMEGRGWEALEANGAAVEAALGLEPTEVGTLHALGALAAGVTGLGPVRAVVVPSARVGEVMNHFSGRPGEVRRVAFWTQGPTDGEP